MAEKFHLPVVTLCDDFEVTVLVDKMLARADRLAKRFQVPAVTDDHQNIIGNVDAAIVAVPHHLHASVTIDLLTKGIHVLVEKPMAMKATDCQKMTDTADQVGVVLTVAMQRRFSYTAQFVKQAIENQLLGHIERFDLREGNIYDWPVEDKAMLSKEVGGGVVPGIGVHALDLLLWWLGDCENVEYYDDAMGGVEADCEFHLTLRSGAKGIVELSRTRNLRNTWLIYGERGVLEIDTNFGTNTHASLRLKMGDRDIAFAGHAIGTGEIEETVRDLLRRQFADFVGAVQGQCHPLVSGAQGGRVIQLIETATARRRALRLPWISPTDKDA